MAVVDSDFRYDAGDDADDMDIDPSFARHELLLGVRAACARSTASPRAVRASPRSMDAHAKVAQVSAST